MSLRLKLTLGILLLAAGFLLIRLGLFLKNAAETAATANVGSQVSSAKEENPLAQDSDHDGLSDRDEVIYGTDPNNPDTDGDGYLDGEEVATGHDPLNPNDGGPGSIGPNGRVSANITQRAANLTMATIMDNFGNIDKSQITDDKLNGIVSAALQEAALSFSVPTINDSDIKITNDNSPESVKKYLSDITPIIEENIIARNNLAAVGLITDKGLPETYPEYYQKAYLALKDIAVPSSWKELHKNGLTLLLKLADSFGALTNLDKDPVRSAYAILEIQDSLAQMKTLLGQIANLAKSQKIDSKNSILEVIKNSSQ